MRFCIVVAVVLCLASCCLAKVPRGVRDTDAARYSGALSCEIGDVTVQLQANQINDGFCDCPMDGFDEPGTAACANGKFWCPNAGFIGKHVFSSRVGDGICDCCDGSDEEGWGRVQCENTCLADADAAFAEQREQLARYERGLAQYRDMVEKAASVKAARELELEQVRTEHAEAQKAAETAREQRDAAEEEERAERERRARARGDVQSVAEVGSENPAETVNTAGADAQADAAAGEGENAQNFPYPAEYAYNADADEKKDDEAEGGVENFPYPAEYAPTAGADSDDSTGGAEDTEPAAEDISGDIAEPEEEYVSAAAENARRTLRAAESTLQQLASRLSDLQRKTGYDYGPEGQFQALEGECFKTTVKQYVYEVCPYQSASQKEGHQSTSLGKWAGFGTKDGHLTMKFENGARCWQGPARQLTVIVQCSDENAVGKVDEVSRCVYELEFGTPAACSSAHVEALRLSMGENIHA